MYKVIQWGYELEGEDSHEPQNQKAHETDWKENNGNTTRLRG